MDRRFPYPPAYEGKRNRRATPAAFRLAQSRDLPGLAPVLYRKPTHPRELGGVSVTRTSLFARAIAAMRTSLAPIGVPRPSSAARMLAAASAAMSSSASDGIGPRKS